MKLYCKYSGLRFDIFTSSINPATQKQERTYSFTGLQAEGIHPIFFLPPQLLLTKAEDWAARKLKPTETRLLFLALLNSTGLVEFRSTAQPAQETIEQNMEPLLKMVLWYASINTARLALPHFVISQQSKTHRLDNIASWIAAWESQKHDWYNRFKRAGILEKMQHKEELLYRLIHSAQRTSSTYAAKLASWAFDAVGLPEVTQEDIATRTRWLALFKLKGWDIYNADPDDLADMLDYFEQKLYLYAGTDYAKAVLTHIRELVHKNSQGIQAALGMIDGNTFEIVEDAIETYNRKAVAADAPNDEPTEDMIGTVYESRVKFLVAKAKWRVAQSEIEKTSEIIVKQKEIIKEAALAISTEEELAAETEDDLQQLRIQFASDLGLVSKQVSDKDYSL